MYVHFYLFPFTILENKPENVKLYITLKKLIEC